jgi:cytochrome c2
MKQAAQQISTLIVLCAATTVSANPFPDSNAVNGQKLFEQHQCNRCHNSMMGGDGNKIFTRFNRKVSTTAGLLDQINICSGNVNAHLSTRDQQDIGAYLNRYYNL